MPRLDRRSAGKAVAVRAGRFSDDLLVRERECFAEIDRVFQGTVAPLVRVAGAAERVSVGDDLWTAVLAAIDTAFDRSVGPVELLLDRGVDLAVDSLGDELLVLERSLAARHVNTARAGWFAALATKPGVVDAAVSQFRSSFEIVRPVLTQNIARQFQLVQIADSGADLGRRLFSREPVHAPGCGGRGVVWGAVSDLNASARTVVIAASNRVREVGMAAMSEEMRGR